MLKHLCLLALIPLLAFTVGCGDKSSSDDQANGPGGQKIKIGVSIPAADHGWTAGIGYWAQRAMKEYPDIEWVYATADKPEKQIADIEDMMAQRVQGLIILATESAPLTPIAKSAKQRGITIVNVDRGFLEPVADIFIEGDNRAFGRKSAQYMVEKLGGKGNIAILRGIPSTVDTDRFDAAMEVFNQHPEIKILAAQPGMWNQQRALEVMQSYLTQFPQIDAVWAADDDMALGVEKAIREAGRADRIWIMGGAGMKDIVKRVMDKDPMYPADITYPPAMIAAGIHAAVAELSGKGLPAAAERMPEHLGITPEQLDVQPGADGQRHVKLDVHLITPDNAEKYYFPDSVY